MMAMTNNTQNFILSFKSYQRTVSEPHPTLEDALKAASVSLKAPWIQPLSITAADGRIILNDEKLTSAITDFAAGKKVSVTPVELSRGDNFRTKYAAFGF